MIFFESPLSATLAWNFSYLIGAMYRGASAPTIAGYIESSFGGAFDGQVFPSTALVPMHAVFGNGYTRFILVGGADQHSQLAPYYEQCFDRQATANAFCNRAAVAAAQIVLDNANSIQGNPNCQFYAGHSYGGAILQAMVQALLDPVPLNQRAMCFTFGSPRIWQRWNRFPDLNNFNLVRYNNYDDPVCKFPPHADEAPFASALMGPERRDLCRRTDHVGLGIQLDADGSTYLRDVSGPSDDNADVSLWAWLLSATSPGASAHPISEYYRRLNLQNRFIPISNLISTPPEAPAPVPSIEPLGRVMQPLEATTLTRQAEATFQQSRGVEPAAPPYKAVRRGGIWTVECLGTVVVQESAKRSCQSFARKMNASWREWYKLRLASAPELINSVETVFPGL